MTCYASKNEILRCLRISDAMASDKQPNNPDRFQTLVTIYVQTQIMKSNRDSQSNRDRVRRYVARKKASGWKKCSFLVPQAVAAEMYRLKDARLSQLKKAAA